MARVSRSALVWGCLDAAVSVLLQVYKGFVSPCLCAYPCLAVRGHLAYEPSVGGHSTKHGGTAIRTSRSRYADRPDCAALRGSVAGYRSFQPPMVRIGAPLLHGLSSSGREAARGTPFRRGAPERGAHSFSFDFSARP